MCAREDGIRRSKDLRAEIGKFPNSTNERKQMSKKTIKQRIALVAVSALTAGVFSVVSAPAAKAADITTAITAAGAAVADGNILVSGNICAATSASLTAPLALDGVSPDATPFETTATGKILTVPVGATLTVGGNASDVTAISGPLSVLSLAVTGTSTLAVTTANKQEVTGPATFHAFSLLATAVGTGTIVAGTATGTTPTTANTITVNIVAACSTGTYSASKSSVSATTDGTTSSIAVANVDVAVTAASGDNIYIMVDGDNAYDTALVSGSYSVSATNGALVSTGTTWGTAPAAGSLSSAVQATTNGILFARIAPASAAAGGTTVVTITHDGTPVTTKTLTFLGEATKINIVSATSGTVSTTSTGSTGLIVFSLTDAAGRSVPGDISLDSLTASARTPAITEGKDATISAAVPTSVTAAAAAFPSPGTTFGVEGFDCTTVGGTGSTTLKLKHTQATSLTSITTEVVALCAGGVDTYTISTDKASYSIGEIATVTITAKDSTGAAVSDATSVGAAGIFTFGGGTPVVAAAAADLFSKGVRKYQAQVTTAGTFNTVVTIAGGTTSSATASYKVGGGDVSNAEILKSIVALIASINKQIAALQKLILKR